LRVKVHIEAKIGAIAFLRYIRYVEWHRDLLIDFEPIKSGVDLELYRDYYDV
jgi:hypothetical protein